MIELQKEEKPEEPRGTIEEKPNVEGAVPEETIVPQEVPGNAVGTLEATEKAALELYADVVGGKKIVCDAPAFHKMVYSLMTGRPEIYLHQSGLVTIGKVRGAYTLEEQKRVWEETKRYIHEVQNA